MTTYADACPLSRDARWTGSCGHYLGPGDDPADPAALAAEGGGPLRPRARR